MTDRVDQCPLHIIFQGIMGLHWIALLGPGDQHRDLSEFPSKSHFAEFSLYFVEPALPQIECSNSSAIPSNTPIACVEIFWLLLILRATARSRFYHNIIGHSVMRAG